MKVTIEVDSVCELKEVLTELNSQSVMDAELDALRRSMIRPVRELARALARYHAHNPHQENSDMANKPQMVGASPILEQLRSQVEQANTVVASATTFINGIPALIADAVSKAQANGATAEELQPLSDLSNTLTQNADALAQAIQANTPTPSAP